MINKIQSIIVSNLKPKIMIHNLWHSLKEMQILKEHNLKAKISENIIFIVRLT